MSHQAPKKPELKPKPLPHHHKMSYTIVSGDTFFSIAQAHGTSVAAIEAANPGVNPSALQVGQVINLPGAGGSSGGNGGSSGGSSVGGGYVAYSGPASNFPDPSTWAPCKTSPAHYSLVQADREHRDNVSVLPCSPQKDNN